MTSLSTSVHPFPESKNLAVVLVAQTTGDEKQYSASPKPVILCLLPHDRKPIEEGHDPVGEIGKSIDLPIPTAISRPPHTSAVEGLPKEIQRHAVVLRDVEGS